MIEIDVEWLQRDVSGGDERRTFRKCGWPPKRMRRRALWLIQAQWRVRRTPSIQRSCAQWGFSLSLWVQLAVRHSGWWRVCGVRLQQLETQRDGGCQGWHRRCTSRWHRHRESCL
jgi:hypothetical protein